MSGSTSSGKSSQNGPSRPTRKSGNASGSSGRPGRYTRRGFEEDDDADDDDDELFPNQSSYQNSQPNSYLGSQYGAHSSGAHGSQYGEQSSGAHSSQYGAHSSQYGAHSSQYGEQSSGAHSSQYGAHSSGAHSSQYGEQSSGPYSSQFGDHSSQFDDHSMQYCDQSSQYGEQSSDAYGSGAHSSDAFSWGAHGSQFGAHSSGAHSSQYAARPSSQYGSQSSRHHAQHSSIYYPMESSQDELQQAPHSARSPRWSAHDYRPDGTPRIKGKGKGKNRPTPPEMRQTATENRPLIIAPTKFSFGNAQQNPFAATPQIFPSSNTFGGSSAAFGQASAPMFGAQQQSAPLFGSSTGTTFGSSNQNAFGTSTMFGQQQQTQPSNMFGAPSTSFGQSSKPGGYTFPTGQPNLFGQSTQPAQPAGNVFQPSGSSNIFGTSGFGTTPAQPGTVIKFVPATGSDSMQKGGSSTMINTKHHSITCMKEYEAKSFEELRWEDYCASRKGPQQSTGFGGASQPFLAPQSSTPLFGQPENKPAFGSSNGFGQTPTFGLSTQPGTSQSVFGKSQTPFGSTITTAGNFGFTNTPSTNVFGAASKPFSAQPTQPLFGTTPQQPATNFGTSTYFGQQTAQPTSSNFFKPTQPAFPSAQPGTFAFGQTASSAQSSNLFQTTKPSTGFSLFGMNTSTSTAFGQPTSSTFGGFNAFAKPAQNTFAQPPPQQPSGFSLPSSNLFGGMTSKPAFGTTTTGTNLFGRTDTGFSMQPQMVMQPQQLTSPSMTTDMRTMLGLGDPFGYAPHLSGLKPHRPAPTHYCTNPKELAAILKKQETLMIPPRIYKRPKFESPLEQQTKLALFDEGYKDDPCIERRNLKRLNIPKMTKKPEPLVIYLHGKIVDPLGFKTSSGFTTMPRALQLESTESTTDLLSDSLGVPGFTLITDTRASLDDYDYRDSGSPYSVPSPTSSKTSLTDLGSSSVRTIETQDTTAASIPAIGDEGTGEDEETERMIEAQLVAQATADSTILVPELVLSEMPHLASAATPPAASAVPDVCGIICTRPEYYTIPPLDEISKYKNEDGSCIIKGFTIGRIGYGNVHFPEVMDVSNLNIDALVHFRNREICIYPEDQEKPPFGNELNRRAQVTLDYVYPRKSRTDPELETNPEKLIERRYVNVLKQACNKHGTEFVDYRPETGSWVFNAPHFSIYGIDEGEEDDIDEEMINDSKPIDIPNLPYHPLKMVTVSSEGLDTCGIVCTKPGYYTDPSLDVITQYRTDNSCYIQDFRIGRIGYGNVVFPGIMDVTNINIDKLVHLEYREICIYPDDKKPPFGEGLNRPAQVTLDHIYPMPLQPNNIDKLVLIKDILRAVCKSWKVNYIDYKHETGSLVFSVKHFSRYSFSRTEEEEIEDLELRQRSDQPVENEEDETPRRGLGGIPQPTVPVQPKRPSSKQSETKQTPRRGMGEVTRVQAQPKQSPFSRFETDQMAREGPGEIFQISQYYSSRQSEADEIQMRDMVDFFEMPVEPKSKHITSWQFEMDQIPTLDLASLPKHSFRRAESKKRVEPELLNIYIIKNQSFRVPELRSVIPTKCINDSAMLKSQSFKVGWAKGFTLATVLCSETSPSDFGFNIVESDLYSQSTIVLLDVSQSYKTFIIDNQKQDDPFLKGMLDKCMETVLQESSCTMQDLYSNPDDIIPFWTVNRNERLIQELCRIWASHGKAHENNCRLIYYWNIFKLCLSFWGPVSGPDDDAVVRRERFHNWLKCVTGDSVNRDLANCKIWNLSTNLSKIFVYLSGYQINQATEVAFKADLPEIAMLISQFQTCEDAKLALLQQIKDWAAVNTADFIRQKVMKLYLVLAGVPFFEDTNIFARMDWLRTLAMHYWYLAGTNHMIKHSVHTYEEAYQLYNFVTKPYPMYSTTTATWDILYQIIRIYCGVELNLSNALSPTTHTQDPLDYRLSWLIMQTLFSLNVGVMDEKDINHITINFSSQLEQEGMYKWAIFVCLFIADKRVRENLVMAILDRSIQDDADEGETEKALVRELNIPPEWIHRIKALKNIQLDRYWISYSHLIFAKMWYEAHEVYFYNIVPVLMCNGLYKLLQNKFRVVSEHSSEIMNYSSCVGVLMEFIKFWDDHHDKSNWPHDNVQTVYSEICRFIKHVRPFRCDSIGLTVAISEVSKHCATFFNDALTKMTTDVPEYAADAMRQLERMIMPLDYKFEEVRKFIVTVIKYRKNNYTTKRESQRRRSHHYIND